MEKKLTNSIKFKTDSSSFANEADVETQLLVPLFLSLGWPNEELHPKVPVNFKQGRTVGRKPEADYALAPKQPRPPKIAWCVIEAKHPSEDLCDAPSQADSYSYMLRSPFFVTCNGINFEIWQTGFFDMSKCCLNIPVKEIPNRIGELTSIISRKSVLYYGEKYRIRPVKIETIDFTGYLDQFSEAIMLDPTPRTVTKAGYSKTVSADIGSDITIEDGPVYLSGWGGRGKTTILNMFAVQSLKEKNQKESPCM